MLYDTQDNPENGACAQDQDNLMQQQELDSCNEQLTQLRERFMYLNAEFDNYKKRTERERAQWISGAQNAVFTDLLPIIDDFERALQQSLSPTMPIEVAHYVSGFELIAKELNKLLKKYGLEEILDVTEFNPLIHEAIMQVSSDKHRSGAIVDVLQKGYKRNDHIVRPAKVSVAQ